MGMVDDPEDKQPEDWDMRKKIDDPAYKGVWKAKQIANEKFVENVYSYDDIGSVGFELWTVNAGSLFDNIFVTDSLDKAFEHADAHWGKISEGEKDAQDAYDKANAPPPAPDSDDDAGDADLDDEDGTDDEDL